MSLKPPDLCGKPTNDGDDTHQYHIVNAADPFNFIALNTRKEMNCFSHKRRSLSIGAALVLLLTSTDASRSFGSKRVIPMGKWGIQRSRICSDISTLSQWEVLESLRAGATREEVESDEEEVESDDEEEVESDDDEKIDMEDEESEEDEDYDEDTSSSDEEEYESAVEEEEMSVSVEEYDTQLSPPPGLHMGALLGVMLLSKKIDMFNPTVVRFIRYDRD